MVDDVQATIPAVPETVQATVPVGVGPPAWLRVAVKVTEPPSDGAAPLVTTFDAAAFETVAPLSTDGPAAL